MTQQIARPSGVVLARDSKVSTLIHIRYSSTNLPNIIGTIRASVRGWNVSVQLPTPDNTPEAISDLLAGYDGQYLDTLDEAIVQLEERISDREEWFNTHKARVAAQTDRQRQEVDGLFGAIE